jgi:amino-acid N-acetyltransferase
MQPESRSTSVGLSVEQRPALAGAVALLASAQLPTEDLSEAHCEHFFFTGTRGSPTALVGLEFFGNVALLRSLVVSQPARGVGSGSALVKHAESYARERGVHTIYLLTTTAETFFERRGFARADRESAPPAIRATREFSGICPASSTFMSRKL